MKKAIIAGAASAVLAAMPVVGVFAAAPQSFTDTLNLSITEQCTFARATGADAHTNGTTGSWGSNDTADTYTATLTPSAEGISNLAKSSFTITCNDPDGYQVTVAAEDLTSTTVDAAAFPWAYTAGGTLATGGDSMWTLSVAGTDDDDSDTNGAMVGTDLANNIITKRSKANPATDNNDSFTITYKAFVDNNQAAGNYSARAVYTFAQLTSDGQTQTN